MAALWFNPAARLPFLGIEGQTPAVSFD